MDHAEKAGNIDGGIIGPGMIAVDGRDERKQEQQDEGFARHKGEAGTGGANGVTRKRRGIILRTRLSMIQNRSRRNKLSAIGARSVIRIRQKVLPFLREYMQNSLPADRCLQPEKP
jgi:hypothetical protein